MTDAQTILKMIESVDPSDTAKLDEIDLRTACLVQDKEFGSEYCRLSLRKYPQYSRSRDALKAIRPDGWRLSLDQEIQVGDSWLARLKRTDGTFFCAVCATEELAELHCIIQAIEKERSWEKQ